MNKETLHNLLGVGDGDGNTSSTRVIRVLLIIGWMAMKAYNAHLLKQPITLDGNDLGLIGIIGATGLAQNSIEKTPPVTAK